MATEFCPECHRPITVSVLGVRMPMFKVSLFRYIEKHPGLSAEDLGRHFDKTANTIKSHIFQINDYLMLAGVKIIGNRWTGYTIGKAK